MLFNKVFKYIVKAFDIKSEQFFYHFDKYNNDNFVSVSTISSWKTRTAPCKNRFKILKEFFLENFTTEQCESLLKKETFIRTIDEIFNVYSFKKEWMEAKSRQGIGYVDLIISALEIAYKYKKVTETSPEVVSITLNMPDQDREKCERMVLFGLDGTLIKGIDHSWHLMYESVKLNAKICDENQQRFERGEISYPQWIEYDCQLLRENGFTKQKAEKIIREKCYVIKGFYEGIERLKENGYKIGIISGGVDLVLYTIIPQARELFENNIFINEMIFDDNGMLKNISATPYDWDDECPLRGISGKNEALKRVCHRYNISPSNVVFVGDDDNDFKAMQTAGKRILYLANKPVIGDIRHMPEKTIVVNDDDFEKLVNMILKQ